MDVPADRGGRHPNRRTIPATCRTHGGPRGFCNLRVTKVNGEIVMDPHIAVCA